MTRMNQRCALCNVPVDEAGHDSSGSTRCIVKHRTVAATLTTGGVADRLDLPERVVVGANGAYWRHYGDAYSMCPVSTDNDPIEPVATYIRVGNPPEPTDDEPTTANGRDLLAHAVQYTPADADRKVTAAKIIAVENEARGYRIGRCGCTIHEDRGDPCRYTGPSSDYRDPLSQVCDTCLRVCWGATL